MFGLSWKEQVENSLKTASGELQVLTNTVKSLKENFDLLRQQWADWRQQLNNAAARLETAEKRAKERVQPAPEAPGPTNDPRVEMHRPTARTRSLRGF